MITDEEITRIIDIALEQIKFSYNGEQITISLDDDEGIEFNNGDYEEIIRGFRNE